MANKIGVLGVQVGVTPDKSDNLSRAAALIDEAFEFYKQIDLICLPELYYSMPKAKDRVSAGEEKDSEFLRRLSGIARSRHVNIITGSYPMKNGFGLTNTLFCLDRDGYMVGEYSKTHLFDALGIRESDTFDKGSELGIFDLDFGRVGTAICYELRFPEYLRTVSLKGVDLLAVPAAFYRPRSDVFETLVRAAAMNTATYVLAVNQFGRDFFGRSSLADPAGLITAQAPDREDFVYGVVDFDYQKVIRETVAIDANRRPELYDVT